MGRGLLIAVAPLVVEHELEGMWISVVAECSSVVVAHRFSCSTACGIFPDQELNLCSLL